MLLRGKHLLHDRGRKGIGDVSRGPIQQRVRHMRDHKVATQLLADGFRKDRFMCVFAVAAGAAVAGLNEALRKKLVIESSRDFAADPYGPKSVQRGLPNRRRRSSVLRTPSL